MRAIIILFVLVLEANLRARLSGPGWRKVVARWFLLEYRVNQAGEIRPRSNRQMGNKLFGPLFCIVTGLVLVVGGCNALINP